MNDNKKVAQEMSRTTHQNVAWDRYLLKFLKNEWT